MIRRYVLLGILLILHCSLCSCGNKTSEYSYDGWDSINNDMNPLYGVEEGNGKPEITDDIIGCVDEYPWEEIIHTNEFTMCFEDYIDEKNPLQLDKIYDDAYVTVPVKSVFVNDEGFVAPMNVWLFPVIHDKEYIGIISFDCREPEMIGKLFSSSRSIAPGLNEALKKGNIALFNVGDGRSIYGIYEDNTVICLNGTGEYNGNVTFEEVDHEYNLIKKETEMEEIFSKIQL